MDSTQLSPAPAGPRPAASTRRSRRASGVALAAASLLSLLACSPLPPRSAPILTERGETERLRQVHVLFEAGRLAEANQLLGSGSEWLPDHVEALRSRILRAQGDAEGALRAAEQALSLGPPAELRAHLLTQIAEIELDRGEVSLAYASARLAWEASRDSEEASAAAYRFAQELERRGLPGEALLLYQTIWQRWPGSNQSGAAFEHSSRLSQYLGADRPEVGSLLEAGERLHSLLRCREAEPFFALALAREDASAEARRRARRGQADCAFQRRRYPESVDLYRALAAEDPADLDVAIMAARARGRAGDGPGAARELGELERRAAPEQQPRIQQLISILVSEDDPELEARLLRQIAEQKLDPGLALEARWQLAWLDLQVRKHQSALRWLAPITEGSKWDIEVQRARYWTAVANLSVDAPLGEQQLAALVEEVGLTYYGMLAADRLGLAPPAARSFLEPRRASAPRSHEARRAAILVDAGWSELARAELRSWLQGRTLEREERVLAAELLHRLGDHALAVRQVVDAFGGNLDQGVDPLWREAWQFAWPEAYGPPVQSATREFEFDSALVYAIMREESLYRPQVESAAGARGLMQLIPPTASRIARALDVANFEPENLYQPATNIRFGTYHLKELLEQFDGSRAHAIAAYNAGPDVVQSWIAREGPLADDAFVDSVPYGETRRYLRRVLRSYRMYRLLYAEPSEAEGAPSAAAPPTAQSRAR